MPEIRRNLWSYPGSVAVLGRQAFGIGIAVVGWLGAAGGPATAAEQAVEVKLAEAGAALHAVVVSAHATPQIRATAETLADYLERISGATFVVEAGDGSTGIAVGLAGDFPGLQLEAQFASEDPLRRDEYLLRSHAQGVWVIGATEIAVEYAAWDLLYRLGHRQFFPGKTWEVVPSRSSLSLAVDAFEKPSFYTRRIWYGHGFWDYNQAPYEAWCVRNRAKQGFGLATQHAYGAIMRRHRQVFEEHPEYLALVDGERKGGKFCLSNSELRKFIVEEYALAYFREYPDRDSVSLEPSDGGGWCECPDCAALGSITDRALLLANEAAEAIEREFPGKYVGFLAYNQHSPPPGIRVHPKVIVKVQTGFIRGGYTLEELMRGWQAQGATIGVGDYYSVFLSDMSRPAAQKGSDLFHLRTSIPTFYERGTRFYMAESSDLWGAIGLGHYLAARLIWDVSEAEQVDAILDDFLAKAFGPAKSPMEGFYRLIYRWEEDDRRPMIRSDMLARMYRYLAEARELAEGDAAVLARLDDLLLFTRYEELFQAYEDASGAARQKAVEELLRHAYRMRKTMMVHAKPITMHLVRKDRHVVAPAEESVKVEAPFTAAELAGMLAAGVEQTQVVELGFTPVPFSRDLVPATALHLKKVEPGSYNTIAPVGRQKFYTWLDAPGAVRLRVSGGHIVHYRDIASEVQVRLYADANPMVGEEVAYDASVAPDGVEREVGLPTSFEGLHQVDVLPPSNRAKAEPAKAGVPWTMESSIDARNQLSGYWNLYFYVPKGTRVVGGFASGSRGTILDGDGKQVFSFMKDMEMPGFFSVEVPAGQDGRLWKFHQCIGERRLMTVPPFLAREAAELLLPREVVEADAAGAK